MSSNPRNLAVLVMVGVALGAVSPSAYQLITTRMETRVPTVALGMSLDDVPGLEGVCCGPQDQLHVTRGTAALWILDEVDCNTCTARQIAIWRRLVEDCGHSEPVALGIVTTHDAWGSVSEFAQRYRFPGIMVSTAGLSRSVGQLGRQVVMVDSTATVVFNTGVGPASSEPAIQVRRLLSSLGKCS